MIKATVTREAEMLWFRY